MFDAENLLDRQYLEMRWRILSLAADFDRLDRAGANATKLASLREALAIVLEKDHDRAEQVQMLLSDR